MALFCPLLAAIPEVAPEAAFPDIPVWLSPPASPISNCPLESSADFAEKLQNPSKTPEATKAKSSAGEPKMRMLEPALATLARAAWHRSALYWSSKFPMTRSGTL